MERKDVDVGDEISYEVRCMVVSSLVFLMVSPFPFPLPPFSFTCFLYLYSLAISSASLLASYPFSPLPSPLLPCFPFLFAPSTPHPLTPSLYVCPLPLYPSVPHIFPLYPLSYSAPFSSTIFLFLQPSPSTLPLLLPLPSLSPFSCNNLSPSLPPSL